MKFEETDSLGSFAALGIGFLYDYNSRTKSLQISRAGSCVPLVFLEFDGPRAKDPLKAVLLLDKITQINSLKYTNNITLNLAETFDDARLSVMLQRAFATTICAHELHLQRFNEFQAVFMADHDFRRFEIRSTEHSSGAPFYIANVETRRRNEITVRSSTLHGLALYISDRIVEDIIAKEFDYSADSGVQKLLNAASILSMLSYALNDRYEPARKISGKTPNLLTRIGSIIKNTADTNT